MKLSNRGRITDSYECIISYKKKYMSALLNVAVQLIDVAKLLLFSNLFF